MIELTEPVLPNNSHAAVHVHNLLEEAGLVLQPEERTALGIGLAHIVDEDRAARLVARLGHPEAVVERRLVFTKLVWSLETAADAALELGALRRLFMSGLRPISASKLNSR